MQTLLRCFVVMPSRDSAAPSARGKRILLATERDGTVELRATKETKRGGSKSLHIVYNCIPNLSFLCSITVRCKLILAFEYYFFMH